MFFTHCIDVLFPESSTMLTPCPIPLSPRSLKGVRIIVPLCILSHSLNKNFRLKFGPGLRHSNLKSGVSVVWQWFSFWEVLCRGSWAEKNLLLFVYLFIYNFLLGYYYCFSVTFSYITISFFYKENLIETSYFLLEKKLLLMSAIFETYNHRHNILKHFWHFLKNFLYTK